MHRRWRASEWCRTRSFVRRRIEGAGGSQDSALQEGVGDEGRGDLTVMSITDAAYGPLCRVRRSCPVSHDVCIECLPLSSVSPLPLPLCHSMTLPFSWQTSQRTP